jgi:carbon monoxide dehydrogenase subunit G
VQIHSTFDVPVDIAAVWTALLDVERVASCLPGASIDENRGGGEYGGAMRIKLGPVTSTFKGTLQITEADEQQRRVVIDASARDTRGQGAAAATITSTLQAAGQGTRVAVQTDMKLAGTAAQFGRGVVNDVSQKLLAEFADRLAEEIQNPAPRSVATAAASEDDLVAPAPAGAAAPSRPAPDDDVLDLSAAGRDAIVKRAVPVVAAAGLLGLLAAVLRRGGATHRPPTVVFGGPLLVIETPSWWTRFKRGMR